MDQELEQRIQRTVQEVVQTVMRAANDREDVPIFGWMLVDYINNRLIRHTSRAASDCAVKRFGGFPGRDDLVVLFTNIASRLDSLPHDEARYQAGVRILKEITPFFVRKALQDQMVQT